MTKQAKRNNRPYYVLLEKELESPWAIQFGDYDRKTVQSEMEEMKYNNRFSGFKAKYKIIRTENSLKATIDKAVFTLNWECAIGMSE